MVEGDLIHRHEARPESVAIVAMGDSQAMYARLCCHRGGRHRVAEETWVVNSAAGCYAHDRMFQIDDLHRILKPNAHKLGPDHHIHGMMEWIREHPGPIYTSRVYPDVPGMIEYPLQDVVTTLGHGYLNTTVAYAVAFAIHIGVRRIEMYGCDFTYPDAHIAEKGRACVEFLLRDAMARGIAVKVAQTSTLLDADVPDGSKFYGYADPLTLERTDEGLKVVPFVAQGG